MALNDQLLNHFKEKFGIVTVVNATFYEVDKTVPLISFDTLKMSNITSEGQQKEIRGGQGAELLLQYDYGRTATVEITDALVSMGSLEYLFGGKQTTGTITFPRRIEGDIITANTLPAVNDYKAATDTKVLLIQPDGTKSEVSGTASLPTVTAPAGTKYILFYTAEKAVGTNKITAVSTGSIPAEAGDYVDGTDTLLYVLQQDGDILTIEKQGSWPVSGDYTAVATDKITVHYQSSTNGGTIGFKEMVLKASDFPPTVRMVGETIVLDADTGKRIALQIEIPKFKLDSSFTLSFDAEGDPSVFDFSGAALSHNGNLLKIRTLGVLG